MTRMPNKKNDVEVDFDMTLTSNLTAKGQFSVHGCFVHLHIICTNRRLCMMSMLALVIIRPLQIAKRALNHNHLMFLNRYVHLFAMFATNTYSKSGENREQANSDRMKSKEMKTNM